MPKTEFQIVTSPNLFPPQPSPSQSMVTLLFLFLRAKIVYSPTQISLMSSRLIYSVTNLTSLTEHLMGIIVLTYPRKHFQTFSTCTLPILVDGKSTLLVAGVKNLGVLLDSSLSFTPTSNPSANTADSAFRIHLELYCFSVFHPTSDHHHLSLGLLHTGS